MRWQEYIESREHRAIEAVYHYHSILNGRYSFTKLRLTGKEIKYGKLIGDRWDSGLHGVPAKSFRAIYGDFGAIKQAIEKNETIFIPEGEKDVDTLVGYGYVAFTYGSWGDWQECLKSVVIGADVIVLADNDPDGLKTAEQIRQDVQEVVKSVKVIIPTPNIEKGDISDFFESHSKEDFEKLIKQETVKEKSAGAAEQDELQRIVDELQRLDACNKYSYSDRGSGDLFADVFKDKHRYNPHWKDFAFYDGKVWQRDIEGMRARESAKLLIDGLISYLAHTELEKERKEAYFKYVYGLLQLRNRNAMLNDSKDKYCFYSTDLDQNSYLLNVKNCVLDLSEKDVKVVEHSPDLLLSKIANVKYDPAVDCHLWKKTLNSIMQGDTEKIKYIQKIFGMSLTGCTREEQLFLFYGASTRNGKSTLLETFGYLMGDYSCVMQPESLAVKANKDSRQASGDLARLQAVRFVNVAEPEKRMVLNTALVKQMTGNDTITARHLHEREFEFEPQFKLIINTNHLPQILDDTVFSSGRIQVVPFEKHFEPQEQDKTLKHRLKKEQELSGILNWAIEGWRLYLQEGLNPPESVKGATGDYQESSDKIGNFINEMLVKTGKNSTAKEIYDKYGEWCEDNGFGIEKLMNKGISLVFIDNPTVSTDYIKDLLHIAESQEIVTKTVMESMVKILLISELARAEKERETLSQRITDGIKASPKKSGRKTGQLDKMTDDLRADILQYLADTKREIKAADLMKKHGISRNTFKKYVSIVHDTM